MRKISNLIIVLGLILIAMPAGFSLYANYNQYRELEKWRRADFFNSTTDDKKSLDHIKETVTYKPEGLIKEPPSSGQSVALLDIPALNKRFDIIEGASWANLTKGPVRVSESASIGAEGSTLISGHRTMYGAPFRDLNQVDIGKSLLLYTNKAVFIYKVIDIKKVKPGDTSDITDNGKHRLILSTCEPLFSSKYRLILISELIEAKSL